MSSRHHSVDAQMHYLSISCIERYSKHWRFHGMTTTDWVTLRALVIVRVVYLYIYIPFTVVQVWDGFQSCPSSTENTGVKFSICMSNGTLPLSQLSIEIHSCMEPDWWKA